jgi:hypothetical protein
MTYLAAYTTDVHDTFGKGYSVAGVWPMKVYVYEISTLSYPPSTGPKLAQIS